MYITKKLLIVAAISSWVPVNIGTDKHSINIIAQKEKNYGNRR